MSLSDIMGNMDLSVYPQIGLVIFLAVFGGVVVRIFSRRYAGEWKRHASIPISDPVRVGTDRSSGIGRHADGRDLA